MTNSEKIVAIRKCDVFPLVLAAVVFLLFAVSLVKSGSGASPAIRPVVAAACPR